MNKKIITFSMNDNFIEKLSDHIDENYMRANKDLSRLAIVFGGKRPALFLKKELAKRIGNSFFSPRFFSIDEFISYTIRKKETFLKVPALEVSYIIYQLALKKAPKLLIGRESFAEFLPWSREILQFVEQLDLENVDSNSLKQIEANAEIGYDVPKDINMLLQNIVALRDACHKELFKSKVYYRGLQYLRASEIIGDVSFDEFDEILFCNFFYFQKTEEIIIHHLVNQNKATLFFQGDQKNWPVLEKASKVFGHPIESDGKEDGVPSKSIKLYSGFDAHSQVCMAREILKNINNVENTVIVLPNTGNVIPLLSEISGLIKEFNVSMGYPLKRSSLFSLFEFISKAQQSKKERLYYTSDYLKALRHPFVKNLKLQKDPSITRILVHKIEEVLTGKERTDISGSLFLDLKVLESSEEIYLLTQDMLKRMGIQVEKKDLALLLCEIHSLLFLSWEKVKTFLEFAVNMDSFLNTFIHNSSLGIYPLNLKIAKEIFAITEELKKAAFNKEIFNTEDIFKIFKSRIERGMMAFTGSPLKGLQILGLFETRSLNFDHVIVLDVNEGVLPSLRIYEPLIPREVMVSLNLDRVEKEEEIQRYQFMRLINGASDVHLIYQESRDKERSRFIEDILWQRQKHNKKIEEQVIIRPGFEVNVNPRNIDIEKDEKALDVLRGMRFSASSVNMYMKCPLRFYYSYVLGLKEEENLLEDPENRQVGTFVHELLEDLYKPYAGRVPDIEGKIVNEFNKTFDKRFHESFGKSMKSDAFLLKEVLLVRLNRFFENEVENPERRIKNLMAIEQRYMDKVKLSCGDIDFIYIVDRIDVMPDDSIMIVDYKTGGTDPMPKAIDTIESMSLNRENLKINVKSFQIPLYFTFFNKEFKGRALNAGFYNLRTLSFDKFIDKKKDFDQQRIVDAFKRALDFLMSEIHDKNACFVPDDSDVRYCANCPFCKACK